MGIFSLMKKTYSDKLLDPRWQRKRLEVLSRDNFTCTLCGDTETTLAVHHKEYSGAPWDVGLDKLKTVCSHCHSSIHFLEKTQPLKLPFPRKIYRQFSVHKTKIKEIIYYEHGLIDIVIKSSDRTLISQCTAYYEDIEKYTKHRPNG